jgi:uncharacterized protein YbjT (DUF2867 family)
MNILLTGATGYIGRLLKEELLKDEQVKLRLFVRDPSKLKIKDNHRVEVVQGDTFDRDTLAEAVKGIDVGYYLIHSMAGKGDYQLLDRISAENFRDACIDAGVKRIVYLGGLGVKATASKHLLSRLETGEKLSAKPSEIQTIWFRASVIIGAGSASFMIIKDLIQTLPIMLTPKWVTTKTQPIAVGDVIRYLSKAKDVEVEGDLIVDIGGEQLSFKEMLQKTAYVMGLNRLIIALPVLTPRLSSYWLIFITSASFQVASALIEGLKSETVIQNDHAQRYFPDIKPIGFEEAVQRTLNEKG